MITYEKQNNQITVKDDKGNEMFFGVYSSGVYYVEENVIPMNSVIYELRRFGLTNDDIADILKKAAKVEKGVKNV